MFGLKKRKPLADAIQTWLKQTVDGAFDVIPETRVTLKMADVSPDENLDAEIFIEALSAAIVMGLMPLKTLGGDGMHQHGRDLTMQALVPTLDRTAMSLLTMRVDAYQRVWDRAISEGNETVPSHQVCAELLFQLGAHSREAVDSLAVGRISTALESVSGSFWKDLGRDFRIV